jgi:hypothetical protein
MTSLNRILVLIILVATISLLLSSPSLASAEIKVTPPTNWEAFPVPTNVSSSLMAWLQNSTKSAFVIIKFPDELSLPLPLMAPIFALSLADQGMLESMDQIAFGKSNFGYRYFVNTSSNASITQLPGFAFIPEERGAPIKGMLILTEKQGDLYAILFRTLRENFDSVLNEIKPTLDSIQFTNSTSTK